MLIEGCLEYQRIGLAPPKSVVDATDEYFKNEDSIANWIEERCEVGKKLKEPSVEIVRVVEGLCRKGRSLRRQQQWFKEEMNRLGYRDKKLGFGNVYEGLSVRQDDPGGGVLRFERLWRTGEGNRGTEGRPARRANSHV